MYEMEKRRIALMRQPDKPGKKPKSMQVVTCKCAERSGIEDEGEGM